jgi:hypothetical protein
MKEQHSLTERLKRLESASGLVSPEDEFAEKEKELEKELNEGNGI